jgi:hypothetical protein
MTARRRRTADRNDRRTGMTAERDDGIGMSRRTRMTAETKMTAETAMTAETEMSALPVGHESPATNRGISLNDDRDVTPRPADSVPTAQLQKGRNSENEVSKP